VRTAADAAAPVSVNRIALIAPLLHQREDLIRRIAGVPCLQLVASLAQATELPRHTLVDAVIAWPSETPDEAAFDAFDPLLGSGMPLVLLLDAHSEWARLAWRTGVSIIRTDSGPERILAAVQASAVGLSAVDAQDWPIRLVSSSQEVAAHEPLTKRELDVLELMAQGFANRRIAEGLDISAHTAKFHVAQVLAKLRSATRTQAVAKALREGLLDK
jgi:DNA-binding NarL/FixJ family response regulator